VRREDLCVLSRRRKMVLAILVSLVLLSSGTALVTLWSATQQPSSIPSIRMETR
jgi:hypothetical protein